jgi:hypothetical protein
MGHRIAYTRTAGALLVVAVTLIGTGCDVSNPVTVPENTIVVQTGTENIGVGAAHAWYAVGEGIALPNQAVVIRGSRYTLVIPAGAVQEPVLITIREHDPDVPDVELGPDGLQFAMKVQLRVDYRGTTVDPNSPNYTGDDPALFWYNPATGGWERMPGKDLFHARTYVGFLCHFSRYAMTEGTMGWDRNSDWGAMRIPRGH